ncbi:hypothetical protein Pint_04755 [Pistacia integerrima]|uniref:Uncharacterized protein n=1 Tax=Pistacia integerrima TaxID=434235 RepID=A0ACC0Z7A7_9ROSI|nr:hypothetical protein Pint_04755 [Pistacia integerrima]
MGKERRQCDEMDDMAKWSAARLKPNSYDFKVEVFNLEYEILNVDPDEYSYICFIKDVKRCVASENEVVEMNPYEKFKNFIRSPTEDNEGFVRRDNEEGEEDIPMSSIGVLKVMKVIMKKTMRVGGMDRGSGVVEGMESQDGERWGEDIEVQREMSEYHEDSSYERSTDDEDAVTRFSKHMKGQQFAYGDNGKIHFKVGQVFEGVDHFRKGVSRLCNSEGIRKYRHSHTCTRVYNNREATTAWVAEKMGDFIRSQKGSSIKPLVDELGRKHYLQLSRSKLYRANQLAKGRSDKLHAESFTGLLKYDHIVKHTNSGSMYNVKSVSPEGIPNFQRCFLGFAAQKKGFIEGCRHFIGVDGCHLKGPYGGVLLSAVSMDANSGIFPVAITICEIENKELWRYFMTLLKEFIRDIDPITIMSDRQKGLGLVDAIRHVGQMLVLDIVLGMFMLTLGKKFPGLRLRNLFWGH